MVGFVNVGVLVLRHGPRMCIKNDHGGI